MADSPILSPQMQAQLEQLLGMSSQRLAEQQPVHAAAMAMAKHLAPGYAQDAMTSGGGAPSSGLGLTGASGSSGGPGLGTTAAASFAAALLQNGGNNPLMLALKKLAGIGGGPGTSAAADPFGDGSFSTNGRASGGGLQPIGGGGGTGDPTQPGGAQGQFGSIGLPFYSPYGGSGSPPTGASGQQPNTRGDEFPAY